MSPRALTAGTLSPTRAVLLGAAVVATLEAIDAVVAYKLLRDVEPIQIFQGVTAGLVGRSAFRGGLATALTGAVLHYLIAAAIVAFYLVAARRFPALVSRPLRWGLAYGVGVYLTMAFVVVPSSALASRYPGLGLLLNGIIGHAVLVGLPSALFARAALAAPRPERAAEGSRPEGAVAPPGLVER